MQISKQNQLEIDKALAAVVGLLCLYGILVVYSSSALKAVSYYANSYVFLKKQVLCCFLASIMAVGIWKTPKQIIKKSALPVALLSLLALWLTLAIGVEVKGATRWISFAGFRIQPSEFSKIGFLLLLAKNLSRPISTHTKRRKFGTSVVSSLFIFGMFAAPILLEPDFGNTVLMFLCLLSLLFVSGLRSKYLIGLFVASLVAIAGAIAIAPYRMKRIFAFLNPWEEFSGGGFQIIQSFIAFHNGGFFGSGIGESKQKLFFLPEAHSDFILSVAAEELGFIGILLLYSLFAYFSYLCYKIILITKDPFEKVLACGISVLILLQCCFNMGVVTGLLPTKGITLPFISAGASSLTVSIILVGILANIAKREA